MPAADKPTKPTPTMEELNTYLEQSAARTKKRLPLIGGGAGGGAKPVSRTLPVVSVLPTSEVADGSDKKAK